MAGEEAERLGELILDEGILTQEEIVRAITESGIRGTPLGAALEGCRYPRRQELAAFVAGNFRVPRLADLREVEFQKEAVRAVPEELARKHVLVPLAKLGGIVCVAKPNYYNRAAVQDLRRRTGLRIKILEADEAQVKAAIERVYAGAKGAIPAPGGRKAEPVRAPEAPREVLNAMKVAPAEYRSEEHSIPVRLLREWEDLFLNGKPSSAIRV